MTTRPIPPVRPARPRPPRRLLAAAAATLLALAAVGCGDDGGGPEEASGGDREELTVVLEWSPNTNHSGVYLAEAEDWYAEAGLDVEIIEPGDAGSLQILGSGKADVAFTVQEELVPARAEGVPVVGLAAVIEHNTSSLLSLTDDGIARPRDLAGQSYGGFGGQLETALVERLVECDGGDPSEVTFAEVGEADYRLGLTRDQYDAVWIFDAWDGIRLGEIEGLATQTIPFIDHEDCIPDWYTPMIASSEQVISKRADALASFMEVTARGYREAMADPDASAEALLDAVPELDRELVERSSEYLSTRYAEDPAAWGRMETERWTEFVDFLVDAELIDEPIDVEPAFTNRFLGEA
ncbi:ABC transporter substrate-binding protein [Iamia sp.]|uniref:ABC transporter substrate-binding protein n=1 Tax=Iamia sp. TaxID=2722710 RepID=UPI002CAB62FC|nr:ABC transporter substrate-binding protein [Iamia sp.]HXH59532.1 ABC transporter substrate-binding protein [Iamia sp.]